MHTPNQSQAVDAVRRYYDFNTRRWFSRPRPSDTIHRAVWGEGVSSELDAFDYLNRLVLENVRALEPSFAAPLHVLDLGCGIGASLIYLATHTSIRGTGVTISGVQTEFATERIARAGLTDRVQCLHTSFLELPTTLQPAHLAFSIEAFIHGPDPAAYFTSAADHLVPGGVLIVCDDMLSARGSGPLTRREATTLHDLREGWHAHSLISVATAVQLAAAAGFELERNVNLSTSLDLQRPRDLVVAAFVALGRRLPMPDQFRRTLVGGSALQRALVEGLVEFRYLVWRRVG